MGMDGYWVCVQKPNVNSTEKNKSQFSCHPPGGQIIVVILDGFSRQVGFPIDPEVFQLVIRILPEVEG